MADPRLRGIVATSSGHDDEAIPPYEILARTTELRPHFIVQRVFLCCCTPWPGNCLPRQVGGHGRTM